ncbi:MAG: galactose-1-phosphate uridylyltransferase [Clostridia bacterium]|nr:galactose-1-phosphate uridylyltransferase [Clostridia bacterium]
MRDIKQEAENLIDYAKKYLELKADDEIYVRNRVLEVLSESGGEELTADEKDEIYGLLSLMPSVINSKFKSLCKESTKKATDWLYNYCVRNDYVKKAVLDKNPRFEVGGLIITINKAKPEFRDPKKAVAGNSVDGGFAKCVICRENEGYGGRAKRNLRTVNISLGGEPWFWQYSPYGYFNEHGIAVNCEHIPMHVDKSTFGKLMDFVDTFPHYFIGCNAPLPRIGGSVLAHDHYQGGGEILPMHKAKAVYTLKHKDYPDAKIEVVDWQGTVVRVVSKNRLTIENICSAINDKWVKYDNPGLGIIHEDKDGEHNAISPTVVKTGRGYEMSVILRSNITSAKYPDGVFHAHPEYHIIKKESIGLIEAQGLFILPGRLEEQLGEIEKIIEAKKQLPPGYAEFKPVYDEVKAMGGDVHEAMQKELGSICSRILENTAVFKDKKQTVKFLTDLGFEI